MERGVWKKSDGQPAREEASGEIVDVELNQILDVLFGKEERVIMPEVHRDSTELPKNGPRPEREQDKPTFIKGDWHPGVPVA